MIELINIGKAFFTAEIETRALQNIDLTIGRGEYVALSGPSGCGKSTLLSLLGLLDVPTTGTYRLRDTDVSSLDRNQRAELRARHIGFVFQAFNLISELSVTDNVMLPLTYQRGISRSTMKARVAEVLDQVEMSHRRDHLPSQLSGGQQQRVAVARALVNDPAIILADEPTGNLDSKNANAVMDLLDHLNESGSTICMVTHDVEGAARAGRQVALFDGQIVADGTQAKPRSSTDYTMAHAS